MGPIHLVQRRTEQPVTMQAQSPTKTWMRPLDRAVRLVCVCGSVLVIPLAFLLFAQWPLRDLVQSYSREANDLAQCLFALYASIAITYATRMRSHLAADAFTHRYSPGVRARLERAAALMILLPWSSFMLYSMGPLVWQSVRQLERFPETYNPGYFVLKLALALCDLLVLLQGLLVIVRREAQ
jgi:TRAP-type mannitol/chloroaromatic compound transport system permease small subunit